MNDFKKYQLRCFKNRIIIFGCIMAVVLCTLFFYLPLEKFLNRLYFNYDENISASTCKVHFVSVGQGDCIIFELPDNKIALLDTGREDSYNKIEKYLKVLNINKGSTIDYLILTHTDSDHIGSASKIAKNYNIKNAFLPILYSKFEVENSLAVEDYNIDYSFMWQETCKALHKGNTQINYSFAGEKILGNNYCFDFYYPFNKTLPNNNDYSSVILFKCYDYKFMFLGDLSGEGEQNFLNYYESDINFDVNFDVDVLKVAHHGSKNSTTNELLSVIKPEISVISCGKNNSYNHPNNETINKLVQANSTVFRTDQTSSVVCGVREGALYCQTNYDKIFDIYLEYWAVVVGFLIISFVLCFLNFPFKNSQNNNKKIF